jgi:hypothetical protein
MHIGAHKNEWGSVCNRKKLTMNEEKQFYILLFVFRKCGKIS